MRSGRSKRKTGGRFYFVLSGGTYPSYFTPFSVINNYF